MTKERTYQLIIAILILVILVGGWVLLRTGKVADEGTRTPVTTGTSSQAQTADSGTDTTTDSASTISSNTTVASGDESVSVVDQKAGPDVTVASVSLSERGWVAVRDSMGRTLGAALFPAGMHSDVSVPLLRDTVAGEHYQVLLYVDDGDKQFDLHDDTLITNADGSVAGAAFTTN